MQTHEVGRHFQKKETGLIHIQEKIPLFENALFALSLFRTRLSDNVLEGKALIEKILAFEKRGNYPCYLHEYPDCFDPYLGLRILPVFFHIVTDFSNVLGSLKEKLETAIERIIKETNGLEMPSWARFRLLSFEGKIVEAPSSVYEWGLSLISLQMAEKRGVDIKHMVQKALDLWHPSLGMYTGKSYQRHQEGPFPMTTLFDLFMSTWQQTIYERMEKLDPILLNKALIYPLSFELEFKELPIPFVDFEPKCETPLLIAWKDHTCVLAKNHNKVLGDAENIQIKLSETLPESDFMEVNFFLNLHQDHTILVNGKKSTTFKMGEDVEILSGDVKIALVFKGEGGRFFGHILRGNRPSQHGCKEEEQFTAFDHRISIRTISRKPLATIRVQTLVCQREQENPQPPPSHASHYPHTASSL